MEQIPNVPSAEENAKERADRKKRKIIKIILIFSAIVVVLSAVFSLFDPENMVDAMFGKEQQTDGEKKDIYFYPLEDSENIFQNEEYAQYDRRLFLHDSATGSTYSIEEADLDTAEEDIIFFYNYFDTVIRGDANVYRTMFTDAYQRANELPTDFTMQMIYDITVTPLGDRIEDLTYKVEYKIYRNNGSFRDDVGSDAILPLCFTLAYEDGVLRINSVRRYTTYDRQ